MPDVSANTAAMIDHLVLRYKQDTALARAKMLSLLQACQDTIWGERAWWFKQRPEILAVSTGVSEYDIAGPVNNVIEIALENGMPLEFMTPEGYTRLFRPYESITGTPGVWTILPAESLDVVRVHIYPSPSAAMNLKTVQETRANVLLDSTGSECSLPPQHRMALIECAIQRMERLEGQIEASQEQMNAYGPAMAAMIAEDARQTKVRR